MISLSKRLKTVADLVLSKESKGIIDVGCDHALLDIYLIQNNEDLKVVASDNKKAPLENARKNIEKYSFLNKIKLKLEDGINNIDDEIDTIVISGMGKETIIDILKKGNLNNIKRLIISSNNKFEDIRKDITSLGFIINDEKIVYEEDKYYVIIEFIKGNKKYTKKELYFGPILLKKKDKEFYNYYGYIKDKKISILKSIPSDNKNKKKIEKEIEILKEIEV